jgi:hypothetical protein
MLYISNLTDIAYMKLYSQNTTPVYHQLATVGCYLNIQHIKLSEKNIHLRQCCKRIKF